MIRWFRTWRWRRRVKRQRQVVKRLTIRLYHLERSPFGVVDAESKYPRDMEPDCIRFQLEKAKVELACLEDWGKGFPIARTRAKRAGDV